MPKKKKTRKQKMLADVRRQTDEVASHTATVKRQTPKREEQESAPTPQAPRPVKTANIKHISTSEYTYLASDLRKTLLLTFVIIGIELVIKYTTGL